MLSIANKVNLLIFCYVCFVCNTNYVFSSISYLFHSLLFKLSNKIISFLFIPLKLSNKIIKGIFQNDCFFFFVGIFLLSTSQQLPLDSSFFQYVLEVIFLIPFFIILFWVLYDVQMSLDPWLGCEEHDECAWAWELNEHQVLFECGHRRY